jgi:hypothetical protein
MFRRLAAHAAIAALVLAAGTVPVLADDEPGEVEDSTPGRGAEWIAEILAHEFTDPDGDGTPESNAITTDDVVALHAAGLGFGEIFKLQAFAYALDMDVETLLGEICDDGTEECEFGWGELKKGLTDDELALFEELPKNLGQIVSASKRGHGRPEHAASFGKEPGRPDVPPGHAKRADG